MLEDVAKIIILLIEKVIVAITNKSKDEQPPKNIHEALISLLNDLRSWSFRARETNEHLKKWIALGKNESLPADAIQAIKEQCTSIKFIESIINKPTLDCLYIYEPELEKTIKSIKALRLDLLSYSSYYNASSLILDSTQRLSAIYSRDVNMKYLINNVDMYEKSASIIDSCCDDLSKFIRENFEINGSIKSK